MQADKIHDFCIFYHGLSHISSKKLGDCRGLHDDCTFDLIDCENINNHSISCFMTYSDDDVNIMQVKLALSIFGR